MHYSIRIHYRGADLAHPRNSHIKTIYEFNNEMELVGFETFSGNDWLDIIFTISNYYNPDLRQILFQNPNFKDNSK